ncbi:oxidoreductase [Candidatus Poribacteria bacterium]|nr:MAG: oxidoreductase [Candidatus Poribacteria bacterium]
MSKKKEYKVIGTRPIRHDGVDKVTGRAIYGADFQITGLLHGRVLRSPHAHARIVAIDTSRAEAHPGVKGVVTAQDLPTAEDKMADLGEGAVNLKYLCDNILASDKALYKGHAIAAVAATDPHIAEEACELIDVEYEVLPPVLEVRAAMEPDAPIIHENIRTSSLGETGDKPSNVASHLQHKKGDIEKGFDEADIVIEREFVTGTVHQGYIEPHNATALYNPDGQLTVWCSTQGAFTVREQLAEILQYPISKIKVVPLEIGGGFGGKINVYIKPVAALLAKKTGKPVKVLMNRADVFEGTGPTPASYITVKMGATKDGKITAAQTSMAFEAGAYPGSPVGAGAMCIFAPYNTENVLIDGYDVVVNKPKTAPYRAPGATNAAFGSETVIDELAEKLNIDPLEIRLMNGAREGDHRADGPVFPRIGFIETVEAAKTHPHYTAPNGKKHHGRGVASGFWFNIGLESSVTINVNPDGTVNLVEGSTDIGGTRASIAMQAAEVLGIPAESVNPTVVDTNSIGYTAVTGGSRTTYATGYAAYEAAQDVVRQMIGRAAKLWDVDEDNVQFTDGEFSSINGKEEQISFRDLSARLGETGGPVVGRATMNPAGAGGAFATHVVDVAVDEETGKVEILRYTATQDAGKAIHPSYVEGQIQGGVVQGIGWALNEEYIYNDEGAMTNASFLDYRMPTCLDLPMIDAVIVEVPNPGHPYGVRGVGEVPIVPPPAAIANAIYDAVGIRMTELPMSPDRLLKAMGKI